MPRGSAPSTASSKRLHSHSHHNSNGQANGSAPTTVKRPSRSRSSSNAVASSPSLSAAQRPLPEEPVPAHHGHNLHPHQLQHGQHHPYSSSDASSISSAGENCSEWNIQADGRRYSGNDMNMAYANGIHDSIVGGDHRKIDINPASEKRKLAGSNATVLPSFPLLDSITLLIIFLQLPSTVLTIIHFLFATMTFVPPSTTLLSASTASTYPPFTQLLLQGSAGSPSILTVILADILVALLSIFLWPSARGFLTDFAQAVMAISLGAGNTGQSGGTIKNAVVCAGVISGAKVIRTTYDFNGPWNVHPNQHSNAASSSSLSGLPGVSSGSTSWIRNAIAVHIVAQGVMRALRGWLIRRPATACPGDNTSSPHSSSALAKDVNALMGKQKDKDPESGQTTQIAQSSAPSLSASDTSNRRKKKTNSLVRNRQPLWAALASTIVHIAKEVEQSKAVSEAANLEDGETGSNTEQKGHSLEGRVWITNIGSSEISFGAGYFPLVGLEGGDDMCTGDGQQMPYVSGIKRVLYPFFVRVNGIPWSQTDIYKPGQRSSDMTGDCVSEKREEEWIIDISGLTPSTEYDFEFVKNRGGVAFYQTSACTMPAQTSSAIAVSSLQPSRPLSPVTTLLNTLQQANTLLAESKVRFKRNRKENNRRLASIRSDIDTLKARLGSGDKGEERARRRVLSLREFVRRAEDEVDKMNAELDRLEKIPEELEHEWKQKKLLWQEEQKRLRAVESKVGEAKAAAGRHASAVESEAASLSNKQEKLTARLSKLKAELDKLIAENASNQDLKVKKEAERTDMVKHRAAMEAEFSEAITKMERKMQEYRLQSGENWAMATTLEQADALQAQQIQQAQQFPPSTPEGLPGTRGSGTVPTSTPPGFGALPNPVTAILASPNRNRSSSLFSSDSNSLSDIIGPEQQRAISSRPSLASLSALAPIGSMERKNSNLSNYGLGSLSMGVNLGPIAPPGFVGSGMTSSSTVTAPKTVPGRLMSFGEPH